MKAYIPLQRKTTRVGSSHWFRTPTRQSRNEFAMILRFLLLTQRKAWQTQCKAWQAQCKAWQAQHEHVEYRSRWVPTRWCSHLPCTFHVFCIDFICIGKPTRTQFPVKYGPVRYCRFKVSTVKYQHNLLAIIATTQYSTCLWRVGGRIPFQTLYLTVLCSRCPTW